MQSLSNSIWVSADALIEKIKQSGDRDYSLVKEHLETAHAYCLGAMTSECAHNLQLAQQASEKLSGKPLEHELKEAIATLLAELQPSAPERWRHVTRSAPPATDGRSIAGTGLTEFFQRAGVSFGIC